MKDWELKNRVGEKNIYIYSDSGFQGKRMLRKLTPFFLAYTPIPTPSCSLFNCILLSNFPRGIIDRDTCAFGRTEKTKERESKTQERDRGRKILGAVGRDKKGGWRTKRVVLKSSWGRKRENTVRLRLISPTAPSLFVSLFPM